MEDILHLCKTAASKLSSRSIDEYEVYGMSSLDNEIEIFNGDVENLSFSDTKGLGIRVVKNSSIGYAYSSNLNDLEMDNCIESAIENSKFTVREEYNRLPEKKEFLYEQNLIDRKILFSEKIKSFNTEDKIKLAKDLERIALKKDKRVKGISNLIYDDGVSEVAIVNSLGFTDRYRTSAAFMYLNVISRQGNDTSTGDYFGYSRDQEGLCIEEIASNAVNRSVSLLGARKIKSQVMDLVLDPFISSQFLGIIAGVISAEEVQKGKSLFKEKIGEKIFGSEINIFDDGTLSEGLASRPFDGEGVPKGRTEVFLNGILKTFLHNTFSARKDRCLSTGNAVRASYKSPPEIGVSNFFIEPSNIGLGKIIEDLRNGFHVVDIIGLHSGTNPISGQISVGAKGFLIKNGSIDFPVKEVTIATDILSFCKKLGKVGNDLKFLPSGGYIGSPSILVKDITVSGD
jgi:PmbA protein